MIVNAWCPKCGRNKLTQHWQVEADERDGISKERSSGKQH